MKTAPSPTPVGSACAWFWPAPIKPTDPNMKNIPSYLRGLGRVGFAVSVLNWRFTTSDARIKLTHLYPKL